MKKKVWIAISVCVLSFTLCYGCGAEPETEDGAADAVESVEDAAEEPSAEEQERAEQEAAEREKAEQEKLEQEQEEQKKAERKAKKAETKKILAELVGEGKSYVDTYYALGWSSNIYVKPNGTFAFDDSDENYGGGDYAAEIYSAAVDGKLRYIEKTAEHIYKFRVMNAAYGNQPGTEDVDENQVYYSYNETPVINAKWLYLVAPGYDMNELPQDAAEGWNGWWSGEADLIGGNQTEHGLAYFTDENDALIDDVHWD